MTKPVLNIVFILLVFQLASADWKVNISLVNGIKDDVTVFVKQSDQVNSGQNTLLRLKLGIDGTKDTTIRVKKYSLLNAYAVLSKGGKTEMSSILINDKNLKFSPELSIPNEISRENRPTLTDFTTSPKLLEFDPKLFMNKTVAPKPISELFDQYLGGLVICIDNNGKDSIIDRIEPRSLGSEMKPYYNSVADKKELYFSNQTDHNVKSSIPGIVELGVKIDIKKLYHLKIVYKGVGEIGWKNENGINIRKNFVDRLGVQEHYMLAKYKLKYGEKLKVYQTNKAYCFEGIYYQLTEMSKISENHNINGSVYFFNNGNYSNENNTTIERTLGSSYIGYWSENSLKFTSLLDYSLSVYYNQQRNLFASLPDEEVVKRYKEMVKFDSLQSNINKNAILAYLDSYVSAYKVSNPDLAKNDLLKPMSITVSENIKGLPNADIIRIYNELIKKANFDLPKDASIDLQKKYLTIMKEDESKE